MAEEELENANVCIMCKKEVQSLKNKIKEDAVINFIRKLKSAFKVAKNNKLYVCDDCMEIYQKKRSKFEQKVVLYLAAGVILVAFIIGFNLLMRGRFDPYNIFAGLVLIVFLGAFSLTDYVPALVGQPSLSSITSSLKALTKKAEPSQKAAQKSDEEKNEKKKRKK